MERIRIRMRYTVLINTTKGIIEIECNSHWFDNESGTVHLFNDNRVDIINKDFLLMIKDNGNSYDIPN